MPNTNVNHNESGEETLDLNAPMIPTVDIETAPLPQAQIEHLFDFTPPKEPAEFSWTPPARWKDEEKIEAARQAAQAKHDAEVEAYEAKCRQSEQDAWEKFYSKAALSPATGRVIAVGVFKPWEKEPQDRVFIDLAKSPAFEERIINTVLNFWAIDHGLAFKPVVRGHNFSEFDFPFLMGRAMMLGLPVLDRMVHRGNINKQGYLIQDTLVEVTGTRSMAVRAQRWPHGSAKLENMAIAFGRRSKLRDKECSGADFAEYVVSSDEEKRTLALNHLEADLRECYDIAAQARLAL